MIEFYLGSLSCNSCNDCKANFYASNTCSYNQNYCYLSYSGNYVAAGCAAICSPGANIQCCQTSNCLTPPSIILSFFQLDFYNQYFLLTKLIKIKCCNKGN